MPLPKPHAGEPQKDFLSRCMESLHGEFPDNAQRYAVCNKQWNTAKQMSANSLNVTVMNQTLSPFGDKGSAACAVLFDSGASHSFVRRDRAQAMGTIVPLPQPLTFTLGDGSPLMIRDSIILSLDVGGVRVTDVFMVHPDSSPAIDEMILGASTMRKFGLKLDFEHGGVFSELTETPAAPDPQRAIPPLKEPRMNEVLKRTLALLGHQQMIPDQLTDEDGVQMIVAAKRLSATSVAAPSILASLSLTEGASEADATAAIEVLKTRKSPEHQDPPPDPVATFAPVLTKLGLTAPAGSTEAQLTDLIVATVKKPVPATVVASKGVLGVLGMAETSTEEEVVGALLALKHPGNVVTVEQHQDLEAQHREYKLHTMIDGALRGRKLTPAEKPWALEKVKEWTTLGLDGLSTLEQFLAKRPPVTPIGERLPMKAATAEEFDDTTLSIARQMGISPETLKKHAHDS